jgi:hypothetical protein
MYGPFPPLSIGLRRVVAATGSDKKNVGGVKRFVLPIGIGDAGIVEDVTPAELEEAVGYMLARANEKAPGLSEASDATQQDKTERSMSAPGARPAGAEDEAGAAQAVRQMFDSIAPNYDRLNHVLSASVDRLWWWQTARRFKAILARPDAAVLDICCGTGHMTRALLRGRPKGSRPIIAADFAREMLARGARQFGAPPDLSATGSASSAEPYAIPIEADALHLPLRPQVARPDCFRIRISQPGEL